MSISQNSLLGPMRKSMGNFTTYKLGGQNIVRGKVFRPKNPNTLRQKNHRACFKLVVDAYNSFGGIPDSGFPTRPAKLSAYNVFISTNLPDCIDKTSDVPKIDYRKLIVARGSLPMLNVTGATVGADGITVNYNSSTNFGDDGATDWVVAFMKTTKGRLAVGSQKRGRAENGAVLISCENLKAQDVECVYLFTTSADEKKASNSVFVEIDLH